MARKASATRVRKPRRPRMKRKADEVVESRPPQQEASYWNWLNTKHRAMQILNNCIERPYWASIEYAGNPPVANSYPCTMFRKEGRVYYGFLIRSHREDFVGEFYREGAQREYTGSDGRTPL